MPVKGMRVHAVTESVVIRPTTMARNVAAVRRSYIHSGRSSRLLRNAETKATPTPESPSTMTSRAAQFAKEQQEAAAAAAAAAAAEGGAAAATAAAEAATVAAAKAKKKTLWQKVKDEATHYWHGTKLLGLEIRISSKLTYKLLNGAHLTRREARQLRRTTSDILRLVPFAVFVVVPFMELLLPVALKLFPNMLPSTYESKSSEEEKRRKLLKVRLEMARFLQETIAETGFAGSDAPDAAKDFSDFFRKIRMTGEQPSTEDLLKVARRFEDELTLDNLSRPQLVSTCKYMNINSFGTDNFLRFQIRNRMRQIKADDKVIQSEGISSLTIQELQHACAARGIRTLGVSPGRLRDDLAQWIELNLDHQVPTTLMILSRAFSFTDRSVSPEDALRATFNSLPDNLVNETELQVLEMVGQSTYKQKIDVLEQQQELIEDEHEQEEKEAKARREAEEAEQEAKAREEAENLKQQQEQQPLQEKQEQQQEQPQPVPQQQQQQQQQEEQLEQQQEQQQRKEEEAADKRDAFIPDAKVEEGPKKVDDQLSEQEQRELQDALAKLRTKVDVLEERAQLNEIKFHHEDYKELVEQLKEATQRDADKASLRLSKKLEKMLKEIDMELDTLEKQQNEETQKESK